MEINLKAIQGLVHIAKAVAEGKEIQMFDEESGIWKDCTDMSSLDPYKQYRVKPEKKYRAFTIEDREYLKGAWIKPKNSKPVHTSQITAITPTAIYVQGGSITYAMLLEHYQFDDDKSSPCGVEIPQ